MASIKTLTAAFLCCAFAPAFAFDPNGGSKGLPSASDYAATMMPETSGVVSWRALAQVEPVKRNGRIVMRFSDQVLALDKQQVVVRGFIMPLDVGAKQRHFLVSAVPASCPYCMPAGPEAIVEVMAKKPVPYGFAPILVSGNFALIRDDPAGLLYRLTDAEPIQMTP